MTVAWSLAITRPNCEFSCSRALSRWSYEHILFRVRRRVVLRGRLVDRFCPAYPRYLFVAGNVWAELRQRCSHVIDFVREGQRIALLPDRTVTSLLAATTDGIIPTPDLSSPRFRNGDQVLVRSHETTAIFDRLLDEDTALILLPWLGRFVPTSVALAELLEFRAPEKARETPRRKRHRRRRRGHRHSERLPSTAAP